MQSHAYEFSETGELGRVEVIGTLQENYIQVSFSLFFSGLSDKDFRDLDTDEELAELWFTCNMPCLCVTGLTFGVFWYVVLCVPVLHFYRS